MKSLGCFLSIFLLNCVIFGATIDNFSSAQYVAAPNSVQILDSYVVGGERDLSLYREDGSSLFSLSADVSLSFPNKISLACGFGVLGKLRIVYDGIDFSENDNFLGLGSHDLTENGTKNAFSYSSTSDLGGFIKIQIHENETKYSYAILPIAADPSFSFAGNVVEFSEFIAGPNGACDFGNVGAIVIEIFGGPVGFDASFGEFSTIFVQKLFFDPKTQGYWKNHSNSWPVDGLIVGDVFYGKDQLLDFLRTPPKKGDFYLILIHQLIATKLNVLSGSDTSINGIIELADNALINSASKEEFIYLAGLLDFYNNQ